MAFKDLNPKEQALFFALSQKAGQQPTSGGTSTDTPDAQAQQGVGNVDASGLAQLFSPQPAQPLTMQEGDKMHPQQALDAIHQLLGTKATGPQLLQDKSGQLMARVPVDQPLLQLLGLKHNVPINSPNYADAAAQGGIAQFLPSGLARLPNGQPFVNKDALEQARQMAALGIRQDTSATKNVVYKSTDQLVSATNGRMSKDEASQLLTAFGNSVPDRVVSQYMAGDRLGIMGEMANARNAQAQNAALNTMLRYSGAGMAQQSGKEAVTRMANLSRANQLIAQIEANGGQADQRQRAELSTALAKSLNPTGVLTNEALNLYLPESAKGKFGNFVEYLTNERKPIDFTGFLPALKDLSSREMDVNRNLVQYAQDAGNPAFKFYQSLNPKGAAQAVQTSQNNPLLPPINPNPGKPVTSGVTKSGVKYRVIK